MYICICNALTDRDVVHAIEDHGAVTYEQVQEAHGRCPQCRRCEETVIAMLQAYGIVDQADGTGS